MESVGSAGPDDFVFVPTLVALLRDRRLKARARSVLVGYGPPVVDALAHFMRDKDEDLWVRRHIPGTLAMIPSQKSVDVLVGALQEEDGFLRYKAIAALAKLRREHDELVLAAGNHRSADLQGSPEVLRVSVAARQPVRQGEAGGRLPPQARARGEDVADDEPRLLAALA